MEAQKEFFTKNMDGQKEQLDDVVARMRVNKLTDLVFNISKQGLVRVVAKAKRWKAFGVSRVSDAFLVCRGDRSGGC